MKSPLTFPLLAAVTLALPPAPARAEAEPNKEMAAVLDQLAALGGKPIETLTAAEARQQPTPADAVKALIKKQTGADPVPEKVAKVEEKTYPSPDGKTELPIRIYTPAGSGPFPVIVYYHGGGWVIADLDTYDSSPRALANAAGAVVVSAHYRQAPEFKFPAAHLDALAAYEWTLKNMEALHGAPGKIAIAGESAGGNMAAAVCIQAKEKGLLLPVHQLLVYPVTDATDLDSPSYKEYADARPLNKPMMKWFAGQTLKNESDAAAPLLSIALNTSLAGLPPATIINAGIDPLTSDGGKLEKALQKAHVPVKRKIYSGVTHEFFGMGAVVPAAKEAVTFGARELKAAFATPPSVSDKEPAPKKEK